MSDLPTFSDASEGARAAAGAIRDHGRTLIPWLPDPPSCECGALMYATETFDPRQAMYVTSWACRACDAPDRYRDDPHIDDPEPPSPGASQLREVLD